MILLITSHPKSKSEQHLPKGKERILYVDDEETILDMGKQMLQGLGYNVMIRKSSLQALETFRSRPNLFDLVITDLTMPKMTGLQLASELLHIRSDIPIVLCTGFSERLTKDLIQTSGIRKFMKKPLILHELAGTIREVLENRNNE